MKVAIFDFDGTLTKENTNLWKDVWVHLGQETGQGSYFVELFIRFLSGNITHKEWCELSAEVFKEKGLTKDYFDKWAENCELIDGLEELLISLKQDGVSLHIVSGNDSYVITKALGDLAKYFDSINGNNFVFDKHGKFVKLNTTPYDFHGKADFVLHTAKKMKVSPNDICFTGNGINDEYVIRSNCKTICLNGEKGTNYSDRSIWSGGCMKTRNIKDIYPLINEALTLDDNTSTM